jgi:hypothetical protein
MKNLYKNLLICTFIVLSSCSSSDYFQEDNTIYTIKVKEHKTNTPLEGARINLYYCYYDIEFGCQKRLLATYFTDTKGETRIPKKEYIKADEGFISSKSQYWDLDRKTQEIALEPEAWLKIFIKTNTNFPSTSVFILKTKGELGVESLLKFKPPKDTLVNFRLFGNQTNKIDWVVYKNPGGCNWAFCIPPSDTLTFGNLSLNPKKFETLTSSINY